MVSKIFQKSNEIIARISALANKMGQIGKKRHIIMQISDYILFDIKKCLYFLDLSLGQKS